MLAVPVKVNGSEYDLLLGIEQGNIERMILCDPMEVEISKLGPPWRTLRLRKMFAVIVTPEDVVHLSAMLNQGRLKEALRYMTRGWKITPEDHNGPYLNVVVDRGETRH